MDRPTFDHRTPDPRRAAMLRKDARRRHAHDRPRSRQRSSPAADAGRGRVPLVEPDLEWRPRSLVRSMSCDFCIASASTALAMRCLPIRTRHRRARTSRKQKAVADGHALRRRKWRAARRRRSSICGRWCSARRTRACTTRIALTRFLAVYKQFPNVRDRSADRTCSARIAGCRKATSFSTTRRNTCGALRRSSRSDAGDASCVFRYIAFVWNDSDPVARRQCCSAGASARRAFARMARRCSSETDCGSIAQMCGRARVSRTR